MADVATPAPPLPAPPSRLDTERLRLALETVLAHRRITAAQAAGEIGIPRDSISALRRRIWRPNAENLALLMGWLRVDPSWFVLPDPAVPAAPPGRARHRKRTAQAA